MRARTHVHAFIQPLSSWTLITSTFSHAQPGHALFNGLTFWFLAPTALAVLGNAQFLALYLGSTSFAPTHSPILSFDPVLFVQKLSGGAFASLSSLVWNKNRNYHSHGASGAHHRSPLVNVPTLLLTYGAGAIYALASFFAFAAPRAQFLLFFVVPMPAWACIGAIACFDVYNAFTRRVRRFLSLFKLPWQKFYTSSFISAETHFPHSSPR